MSTSPKFRTSKEAKDAGWFSRRHETNKEHEVVKAKRKEKQK